MDDEGYDGGRRRRRTNQGPDPLQPPRQRMRLTQDSETGQVVRTGTMSPPYSPGEGMLDPHDLITRRIIREELRPIREAIVALRQDINALSEELRGLRKNEFIHFFSFVIIYSFFRRNN